MICNPILNSDFWEMKTFVYNSKPALKSPGQFFCQMRQDVVGSLELAVVLASRDIRALYRQTLFGYIWAFLPLLGTTGVFMLLRSGGAFTTADSGLAYPVFLLVGSTLWQVFSDSVHGPLKMMVSSRTMITKINFPKEALIFAGILVTLFNFLVRLSILIPALLFFAWKGLYTFYWSSIVLFPIGVVGIILLGYGIGVAITPLGLLYKDVSLGISMLLMFWMFLTPVVFTIPDSGLVAGVMKWNPVSPMIDTARAWLVGTEPALASNFFIVLLCSIAGLFIGWVVCRVSMPHVIERLGG